MKTSEVLRKARALIEDPARWTREAYARDIDGNSVPPSADDAAKWCALGALGHSATVGHGSYIDAKLVLTACVPFGYDAPHFNDTRTHAEVLELFDCAIAQAEAQEGGATC